MHNSTIEGGAEDGDEGYGEDRFERDEDDPEMDQKRIKQKILSKFYANMEPRGGKKQDLHKTLPSYKAKGISLKHDDRRYVEVPKHLLTKFSNEKTNFNPEGKNNIQRNSEKI